MRARPTLVGAVVLALALGTAGTSYAADHRAGKAAPRPTLHGERGAYGTDAEGLPDVDARGGAVAPLAAVTAAVGRLGSGITADYTAFGTVRQLTRQGGGFVATGLRGATPAALARAWVADQRDLFGFTDGDLAGLAQINDHTLSSGGGHVVTFQQTWDGIAADEGGLVIVSLVDGKVASLTSTAVGGLRLDTTTPRIGAEDAVLAAAHDAGVTGLEATDLHLAGTTAGGLTQVVAPTLHAIQHLQLVAVPMHDGSARLAWHTALVEDVATPVATATLVDAVTGKVLVRHWKVDSLADLGGTSTVVDQPAAPSSGTFSGSLPDASTCDVKKAIAVPEGTASITVVAAEINTANDIVLSLLRNGSKIAESDNATSPEVVPAQGLSPVSTGADVFQVQVCPYPTPDVPLLAPFQYQGSFTTSDAAVPSVGDISGVGAVAYPPTWKYFQDSPALSGSTDVRTQACWDSTPAKAGVTCQEIVGNPYSPSPWDATSGVPTFMDAGNNAREAQAWTGSTITAGGDSALTYASATRDYNPAWADQWKAVGCEPVTSFATGTRNDIDAAETNLMVGHDLVHDFAYRLGYTEANYNNQLVNYSGSGLGGDPETGNVQSGALTNIAISTASGTTGEALPVTGRDNANQLPEMDGVPGITNQYLFQPILGFYSPCVDGDMDFSVFGHEYTHEISNRLIAGPMTGLSGQEGGSMGESWSDLDALEILDEFGTAGLRGEPKDVVGAYVTGNPVTGIRDYALGSSPLVAGDIGFDTTGPEVHADGEIWNAIQWYVRSALVEADKAAVTVTDKECSLGKSAAGTPSASGFLGCSGNRHWIQYVYDSLVMQANGAPTFQDMKDEMLAAAKLRGQPQDLAAMQLAFAQKGLGANSRSTDADDPVETPGFASPNAAENAAVRFVLTDKQTGAPVAGSVYVGQYQARATPTSTTLGGDNPPATATMAKGTYEFLVQAPGFGEERFTETFTAGQTATVTFALDENYASTSRGATITGDGVRLTNLIDDDEATDAGFDGSADSTPIAGKAWTVALGGGPHTIQRLAVSAEHHPVDANDDTDFQSRITDLRAFDVYTSSDGGKTYTKQYASPADFFPQTPPRTVVPTVILRGLQLAQPVVADHVKLVVRTNACTGVALFHTDSDQDPLNDADCSQTAYAFQVTAAELQVFAPGTARAIQGGGSPVTQPSTMTATKGSSTAPFPVSLAATGGDERLPLAGLALVAVAVTVVGLRRRRGAGD